MVHDLARRRVGDARRQIPSLFHALGLDAGDPPTLCRPAVTSAPRSLRARPPAPTHALAARVSPVWP
jgi:hypothetical protein